MAGNEPEHEDMFDPAMVEEFGMMFDDEVPAYSCVKVVWCAWPPPPSCHGDSRVCSLIPMQTRSTRVYTHTSSYYEYYDIYSYYEYHIPTLHRSPIARRRPCLF